MNNTQVVTLRMPKELKRRLEREAKYQGTSLNQLTNYLVNVQLTHMEAVSSRGGTYLPLKGDVSPYHFESRVEEKSVPSLKRRVRKILDKVPEKEVPSWDSIV